MAQKIFRALGLMSGTSLDGIDVALVETDGMADVRPLGFFYQAYDDETRHMLRGCFGAREKTPSIIAAEQRLTDAHTNAVMHFLQKENIATDMIDMIGFHGQTITHDPAHGFTWQLGNGAELARQTGIDVIYDFRTQDVAAGGQGAPLIPVYHWARAFSSHVTFPVAILNIGGVSNVTWLGRDEGDILAFDCGAGNALIDDRVLKETGHRYDKDGAIALSGHADADILARWFSHPFFDAMPPKSLDRDAWDVTTLSNIPLADAVATLTAFTIGGIVKAADYFPEPVTAWYVTGGGRLNPAIMNGLRRDLKTPVHSVDALGWNGDGLEAEGFAYLAVRSALGLPLSFPTTTGVPAPQHGGVWARKK